jgi:CCR4-NOT transcriptional regulation complex NOT5 subunit
MVFLIYIGHPSTNRNWRYHKKLQLWLTKDDMMLPQPVNAGSERGYYIFFDPKTWSRDRVRPEISHALEQESRY